MDEQEQLSTSQQADAFYKRFLLKTAIRCVLWFVMASIVVHFFPEQTWVWYVAIAFIFIAIAFAVAIKLLAIYSKHVERKGE